MSAGAGHAQTAVGGVSPIIGSKRVLKRAFDISLAAVLLVLFLPVLAILALFIKLQDSGPAFYRRRVVGPRGEFDAFKLRTMRVNAAEILERDPALLEEFRINFKLRNDPRITALGAVLRKTSLDELPQLWNVILGDMSLVGPRMITPAEMEKYGQAGWIFHCVKPGLTGYWQIQGRQDVTYAQRIEMDVYYVENWSLALDVKILLKTPWRVLRGAGAW